MKCAIPVPPRHRSYYITAATAIDGDTVRCTVDLGLGIVIQDAILRVQGIDAPETNRLEQRAAGEVAKAFTAAWLEGLDEPSSIWVQSKDKYGRLLGDVIPGVNGRPLGQWLLANGVVRRYGGELRLDWPEEELVRIAALKPPATEDIDYDA